MERLQIALEVGPIAPDTVARLKAAGFDVYKGNRTWRVVAETHPDATRPVIEQARAAAFDILLDYQLDPLHTPPSITLRDPDDLLATSASQLILEDARRANDPDPLPRPKRRWWQKQMELGLGERKGD